MDIVVGAGIRTADFRPIPQRGCLNSTGIISLQRLLQAILNSINTMTGAEGIIDNQQAVFRIQIINQVAVP